MAKKCGICGEEVVHEKRKWKICLDCAIDLFMGHAHTIENDKDLVISCPTEGSYGRSMRATVRLEKLKEE